MYQLESLEDTIAAVSTPLGQGGIGIVRLSGPKAITICAKIFLSRTKNKNFSQVKSHTVHYGWAVKPANQEIIDEVLVTVMRAPASYTREDVVEISCHGGGASLKAILQLTVDNGARLAEPGEFTKRAFLNGRIDLPQAEAVLDIICAKTDAFLKVSTSQLKGELSQELESIRQALLDIYTELEAIVNFPEDDLDASGREAIRGKVKVQLERVKKLLGSSQNGRLLKEGIKIVLCGKPNVGKSSLLNVLLKQPRAIVTAIAGTTRDTIEETAQIKGIPFQLVDTAGILEPRDLVEKEAIKRSRLSIDSADLILLVLDGSEPLEEEDKALIESLRDKNILVVINKGDLAQQADAGQIARHFPDKKIIKVSALKKTAIEELENTIVDQVLSGRPIETDGILISNLRHIRSLTECETILQKALTALSGKLSLEFVSEDVKAAVNHLDAITGRNIDQDLLDKIFSEFCIGK